MLLPLPLPLPPPAPGTVTVATAGEPEELRGAERRADTAVLEVRGLRAHARAGDVGADGRRVAHAGDLVGLDDDRRAVLVRGASVVTDYLGLVGGLVGTGDVRP